jgi:hypothetical protein
MTLPQEGWGRRAIRPSIGWGGVILLVACLVFLVLLAMPILRAVNRWADGDPVDMTGFAAVIGAAVPALAAIWDFVRRFMTDRHIERRDQIARGQAPGPFVPSQPPTPDGGLVNNEAIE